MISSRVDVKLSIDVDSDPISGYLHAGEAADPQPFSGWVELSGAIEQARLGTPADEKKLGGVPGAKRPTGK